MVLVERFKRGFVAGLALVAPLFITIIAFQLIFSWLSGVLDPIIEGIGLVEITGNLPYVAEVVALIVIVVGVALLGYFAERSLGAYLFALVDRILALVPVFSVVYTGVRQVSDALMNQQSRFERVVLVEYPRRGINVLGFVTAESPDTISTKTGEETFNVYLPNSPNPTNGILAMVPESEITELDMSVRRGIRLLVTTGIAESREEIVELDENFGEEFDDSDPTTLAD